MKLALQIIALILFYAFNPQITGADDVMTMQLSDNGLYRTEKTRIYNLIQNQARYLIGTVHDWNGDPSMKLLTESKSQEHWIRPNACTVEALCFLHRFGDFNRQAVGMSREEMLDDIIVPMIRYLITTHKIGGRTTGDGEKWGDAWQSAHWAHMLGRGAWWTWDSLPGDIQAGVRELVAHEADRIASSKPPHRLDEDSKSEENAWNSQILSVGVLIMPEDARRQNWETALQRWAVSAYIRPADEFSDEIVDGRPLKEQFTGANIYDDFTLENHGFIHPDYMSAFILSFALQLDYITTGRIPLDAFSRNVVEIYENLKWMLLPDGGFVYPNGQDWRLFRNPDWLLNHAMIMAFFNDPEARMMLERAIDVSERMQSRHPSGAIYADSEYFFASTQQHVAVWDLLGWLSLHCAEKEVPAATHDKTGVRYFEQGKFILNRTGNAVHTLSWGKEIITQCIPLAQDRVLSPLPLSGCPVIRLAGEEERLQVTLKNVKVTPSDTSFEADLELVHGDSYALTSLHIESGADGTLAFSERTSALKEFSSDETASAYFGILNNPEWVNEDGERTVRADNGTVSIAALSGGIFSGTSGTVTIDSSLSVKMAAPVMFRYEAAMEKTRARATDSLSIIYTDGTKNWRTGDVISDLNFNLQPVRK